MPKTNFNPNDHVILDGAYPAPHQQNPYQTQGPPPQQQQQQQQQNPSQSLTNSAPQQQARLTNMAPPTAPPTPPTQQQQQQQQPQSAQYVQQGNASGQRSQPQYQRAQQQQVPRRTQQQQQQPFALYQTAFPQPFIHSSFIPSGHLRTQTIPLAHQFSSQQLYQQMAQPLYFNPQAQPFQQMAAAPATNGQRQTATPTTGPPPMGPPANEYSYANMYDMAPPVMPAATAPPAPVKTVKKQGSNAIAIINPDTGKSIFEKDEEGAPSGSSSSISSSSNTSNSVADKPTVEHHHQDAHEKESAEPQTPVVSAMSDGPSVDITPKHQVNKAKKM
jgi:hypothetical protein